MSALVWAGLAAALGALQALSGRVWPLWPAAAALVTAALVWAAPSLGSGGAAAAFLALAAAFALAGRKLGPAAAARRAAARIAAEAVVGREAEVLVFNFHEGEVRIDGETWFARLEGTERVPQPGDRLRVVAADGRTVWVRPL